MIQIQNFELEKLNIQKINYEKPKEIPGLMEIENNHNHVSNDIRYNELQLQMNEKIRMLDRTIQSLTE